jgi:putative PEP-CTERM system histidine kinase
VSVALSLVTLAAVALALGFAGRMGFGALRGGRSRASGVLGLALALTAGLEALDLLCVLFPAEMPLWRSAGLIVEGAMCPAWVWFTALFARDYEDGRLPALQRGLIAGASLMLPWGTYLAATGAYFAPDFSTEMLLFLLPGSFYFYIAFALCCVAALFNIEATLSAAVHFRRWKIKFVLMGAVSILAALILYYSQGLLYRSIDMRLAGLRSMALLLGAGMMWFSDLRRGPEVRVSFSRRLAFKSVVLVAAGMYLVALGLMGEGARLFGDELGRTVLLGVSFAAGIGLLMVFLSETARRRIRLFLQLHFYGEKYDYRIQWVQFTDRLVAARNQAELHQAALSACCETFGIVGAALFLFDHGSRTYLPVSLVETDPQEGGFGEDSHLAAALRTRRAVVRTSDVNDRSPWMDAARFAIPIFRDDSLDGFVLLGPPINPAEEYDEEDFELMDTMARHISSALLNMRLTEQLARSREMEIMGRVSAFVLHDLKNHVYTLSLMAENARKFIGHPEFQKDLVDSLGSTVGKMKILISQLKGLPDRQTLKRAPAGLLTLARESTRLLDQGRLTFGGEDAVALVDAEEMGKVVLNLCLNALEASPDGRPVAVSAGASPEPFVRVADQGGGIDPQFLRSGLFEPFKSTKAKGMGIGLYQCKQIVESHGGRIEVKSAEGEGSEFTVWLPAGEA